MIPFINRALDRYRAFREQWLHDRKIEPHAHRVKTIAEHFREQRRHDRKIERAFGHLSIDRLESLERNGLLDPGDFYFLCGMRREDAPPHRDPWDRQMEKISHSLQMRDLQDVIAGTPGKSLNEQIAMLRLAMNLPEDQAFPEEWVDTHVLYLGSYADMVRRAILADNERRTKKELIK